MSFCPFSRLPHPSHSGSQLVVCLSGFWSVPELTVGRSQEGTPCVCCSSFQQAGWFHPGPRLPGASLTVPGTCAAHNGLIIPRVRAPGSSGVSQLQSSCRLVWGTRTNYVAAFLL